MKPYIIAETAYHHQGDSAYLLRMIDDIADLNLEAVKFHLLLNAASYMQKSHPLFKATREAVFTRDEWDYILHYASSKNLDIIALCDDLESLDYILESHLQIPAIELHATSINDYFSLLKSAQFPGRVVLGISGSAIEEIEYAVRMLKDRGKKDTLLMYGFQSYPTDYRDINLSKMLKIRELFDLPIGYADHTAYDDEFNICISAMAAAMGIPVLEKHYTPEHGIERIDYHAAVGKTDMVKIKRLMQTYLTAYGRGHLTMSEKEARYGMTGPMKKAIVARKEIKKGEKLTLENLWFKRTMEETPLKQNELGRLIGLEAVRDINEDEVIDYSNVGHTFKRPDRSQLSGLEEIK